ncbi:DUF1987 domain-containing protein [Flammeovirga yaeyamensis]|uniref:DUF1987 domain-containing protein n=1 Tax=Flammeovirga yaeyamensis TaxID=367791 RepID=A0AAX1MY51_9BACT|nr:SiaC family regulatory phosphoprotein [Flammeovirga yaeyamensis]MBB3696268.1 hypothetical protein [Flammeovirga yaeyamensis]NMF34949.1 DUF1987 domain-containing protein [Flammeovirga yaeyamensis]QWG00226.1 DUF1987 domain-containing protein [Flammeovirga yaeyamensis]
MNDLIINKNSKNIQIPQVTLKYNESSGNIYGQSFHITAAELYREITMWIDEYFVLKNDLSLTFGITYFDTASSKGIFNVLETLKKWQLKGKKISIVWYVLENDDDLLEDIEELSESADVHISTILSDKSQLIAS